MHIISGASRKRFKLNPKIIVLLVLLAIFVVLSSNRASAAGLSGLSDNMSRLDTNVASNHTIRFTTASGAGDASDTIVITFPDGFTVGSVDYTDIDLSHGASTGAETEETLAATAGVSAWGAVFSGQVLTLTHPTDANNGDIALNDKVIVEVGTNALGGNAQITNSTVANTYTIQINGTFGDSGKLAIVIIGNDQYSVTASVDPTITLILDHNSTLFGVINSTSVTTSSPNIGLSIATNAASGYSVYVQDAGNGVNPGLYNNDAGYLVGSADASFNSTANLASSAGYGIQATSSEATISSDFSQGGDVVGKYSLTPVLLATKSSTADNDSISIISKVKVLGSAPAGEYADTGTVIATSNF